LIDDVCQQDPSHHRRHRLLRQRRAAPLPEHRHREIRIFSRDEKKQDDMRKRYNSAS
jgi:hypothetical protein